MNKYVIKAQKQKEKNTKRTLRKARVPKDATPEQVKAYLIHYVSRLKKDFYKLIFPDELLLDPDFLLALYKANPRLTMYSTFKPNNDVLYDNIDFMMQFVKISHQYEMSNKLKDKSYQYWSNFELKMILKNYTKTVSNPEFVKNLVKEFSDIEIIPFLKECLIKIYSPLDKERKEKEAKDLENYKKCLSGLPIDLLCKEARQKGCKILYEIPKDIPNFNQIVSAGIEKDGFKSLCTLDITQVLDNIDLIVKAYEKDGIQALAGYIQHTLSPMRTHYYMCHGEEHDYTTYDKRYEEVQKALLAAPEIKAVFDKEKLLAKTKEIRTTQLSIEPSTVDVDPLSK